MKQGTGKTGLMNARAALVAAGLFVSAMLAAMPTRAADPTMFGVPVKAHKGLFQALKGVNVRALPKTSGARIGKLKAGTRVQVVARSKDRNWLVIMQGSKPKGFVYAPMMMPLVDGELADEVSGSVDLADLADLADVGHCKYRLEFEDRSPIEGQPFQVLDYAADVVCGATAGGAGGLKFPLQLFMTETPYQFSPSRRIYQINVDLREDFHAKEDPLTVIFLFNQDKGRVTLDTVTIADYRRPRKPAPWRPATAAGQALMAALEMALESWNDAAWKDIVKAAGS